MSKASSHSRFAHLNHSLLAALLVSTAWPQTGSADALDHWHWRNPLPNSVGLKGIAFGNSRFVGVGDGGWILSSTNQQNWTTTHVDPPMTFNNVIANENGFLAFGYWETNGVILKSPDGSSWTSQTAPEAAWMADAVFARNQFIGVGSVQTSNGGPSLATSPDGLHWTTLDLSAFPDLNLNGIAYGDGRWVAVGDRGLILTSTDGENWNVSESGAVEDLQDIVYGHGQFVAVGFLSGTSTVLDSPDGVEWTTRLSRIDGSPTSPDRLDLDQVARGDTGFVAMGSGSTALFSPDGQIWTEHTLGQVLLYGGVAYGNGQWVAGGRALMPTTSFTTALFTSVDGREWTDHTGGVSSVTQNGIAFGNDVYVTVGTGGRIARSTNGIDWSLTESLGTSTDLARVIHTGSRFLALGSQGNNALLLVSEDGRQWTNRTPVVSGRLLGAAFGNGQSIVVSGGRVLWSTNGEDWALSTSTSASNLFDVVFDGRQFVAAGQNGTIQTSHNGVDWVTRPGSTNASLRGIAFGGSTYVAVGTRVIVVSTNAVDWVTRHTGEFALQSVAYGGGWFVAAGSGFGPFPFDVVLTSSDGRQWTKRYLGGMLFPRCLAFDGRSFLLGGTRGAILQSDPIASRAPSSLILRWTQGMELFLTGDAGQTYAIESTENLGSGQFWTPVATVRAESVPVRINSLPTGAPHQFYRARSEP
ncbi:MAG: hypothetical protein JNK85_28300 [Verrucomicrobiales bacterium]|nr:hypothetical protein [Verrucomicrobiales bacterium]